MMLVPAERSEFQWTLSPDGHGRERDASARCFNSSAGAYVHSCLLAPPRMSASIFSASARLSLAPYSLPHRLDDWMDVVKTLDRLPRKGQLPRLRRSQVTKTELLGAV